MLAKNTLITVEKRFNRSPEVVWEAITQHQQMVQWFFENIPAFKPEVGFETRFIVYAESREFIHLWKILEVKPYQRIVYDWRYKDLEGAGEVIFEIIEENEGALLKLTNLIKQSFSLDIPEFTVNSCKAGWEYFIRNRLTEYLANFAD